MVHFHYEGYAIYKNLVLSVIYIFIYLIIKEFKISVCWVDRRRPGKQGWPHFQWSCQVHTLSLLIYLYINYLSIYLFIYLSFYLSIYLTICLSFYVCIYLSRISQFYSILTSSIDVIFKFCDRLPGKKTV